MITRSYNGPGQAEVFIAIQLIAGIHHTSSQNHTGLWSKLNAVACEIVEDITITPKVLAFCEDIYTEFTDKPQGRHMDYL